MNSTTKDDLATDIYEIIESKYPEYYYLKLNKIRSAGKITGMIIDLGGTEMQRLLNNRSELNNVIDEAYEVTIVFFNK